MEVIVDECLCCVVKHDLKFEESIVARFLTYIWTAFACSQTKYTILVGTYHQTISLSLHESEYLVT